MHSFEIKKKYIEFFKSKKHKVIPNKSLIPENDPTSLFIMAGMQPLMNYFTGASHPQGKRLVNVQRCLRTDDIEEVGDTIHHTFFEMLGNWSLGDYFKNEAIKMTWDFLTQVLNFDPKRLYVTVFEGDKNAPRDEEAIDIWKNIFRKEVGEAQVFDENNKNNLNARIFPLPKKENWWGPVGETGPCGPDSEIFYWRGKGAPDLSKYVPWDESNMFIEVGNNVFMQYDKKKNQEYVKLKEKNIDFGGGFERIVLVEQFRQEDGSIPINITNFNTDLFEKPLSYLRSLIEDETVKSTRNENPPAQKISEFDITKTNIKNSEMAVKSIRTILDHMRAVTFLIADGVRPSNKDQGYILRRLIRRAIRFARLIDIKQNIAKDMTDLFIEKYKLQYPQLKENREDILNISEKEEVKFEKTIERGKKELDKLEGKGRKIGGEELFYLYETHGFPLEMALDELGIEEEIEREKLKSQFNKEKKSHQEESRKGAKGKFKGGLSDHSQMSLQYHTTTHLLLKALQIVLGEHVHQRGSNITEERLRFDFSHSVKLTNKEIKKVEKIVNEQIQKNWDVKKEVLSKKEALQAKAECEFPEKYPDKVTVYSIGGFSKEICGGPHVENTSELAKTGKFKITDQENIGSGVRRVKAVLTH